jgi:hypothetical protein
MVNYPLTEETQITWLLDSGQGLRPRLLAQTVFTSYGQVKKKHT